MEIVFKKGQEEVNSANWSELGQPKDKKQWKEGRSSKEFAKFALSKGFHEFIAKVLQECGVEEQNFTCEPEAKTSIGKGFNRGGCRNHDLLMIGDKDCVIGIEAKVSEPFGNSTLKDEIDNKKILYNNDETQTRGYKLRTFFNLSDADDVNSIGYQLFTATKGTMESAKSNKKKSCIVLVIVFTGRVEKENDYKTRYSRNNDDFNKFTKALGCKPSGHFICQKQNDIECWIMKKEIEISTSYKF